MHAHDFVLDERGNRQVIEKIRKLLPNVGATVFFNALIVETIDLGNTAGFVVASDEEHAVLVPDLVENQERDYLNTVEATVNVITKEKIVCVWELTTHLEQFHQVVELSMSVSTNRDWSFNLNAIRLHF